MASGASRTIERVHALTGVVPLAAYLLLHVAETAYGPAGRDEFADALTLADGSRGALAIEIVFILIPLLAHAALGVLRWRRTDPGDPGAYASPVRRRAQRITGVVVLLFLVVHLGHTFAMELAGYDGAAIYDRLRVDLGKPAFLAAYAVGLACVAFHFAQGVAAAAKTFGLVTTASGARLARGLGTAAGALIWLVTLNTMSHFAVGRAFVRPDPAPPPAAEAPAEAAP